MENKPEKKKKVTDEEIVNTLNNALDEYGDATKTFIRKIFDKMVERTCDKFSDIFDNSKIIIKRKLEKTKKNGKE